MVLETLVKKRPQLVHPPFGLGESNIIWLLEPMNSREWKCNICHQPWESTQGNHETKRIEGNRQG